MDQLHLLLLLSFSMLVGSFLAGSVPMAFKLSDSKSRLLALMGSGILVGTALAIIIPEGIDSIYAQPSPLENTLPVQHPTGSHNHHNSEPNPSNKQQQPQELVEKWTIGLSLVAGFVLMLLIDQFSIYQNGDNGHSSNSGHDYSLANQDDTDLRDEGDDISRMSSEDFETTSETRPIRGTTTVVNTDSHRVLIRGLDATNHNSNNYSSNNGRKSQSPISQNSRTITRTSNTKVTPTLGLVIHASADGIALGAAATTSHRHVEMIIFLAIMLHKAPAAFSLVVFLLHRGLKHATIRRHLLAFSLSAPLAALVTYFGLSQSGKEALRRNNATGIAMLFSAGTFLYVATVHVLPELVHNKLLTPKELLLVVGGAFLPILMAQIV